MSRETINLGRVGFVDRGDYDHQSTYYEWDMVMYNGSSYAFIEKRAKGIFPDNETYWRCIAKKGDKGTAGASVEATSIAVGKYKWEYNEEDESMSLYFTP